jgi:ATP-dependent DNA helicase RecG
MNGMTVKLLKKFDNISWNKAIIELHKPDNVGKI